MARIFSLLIFVVLFSFEAFASANDLERDIRNRQNNPYNNVYKTDLGNVDPSDAQYIPRVNENLKVYDYADILTSEQEKNLRAIIQGKLMEELHCDGLIVTLPGPIFESSENFDANEYFAKSFFFFNDFGFNDFEISDYDAFIFVIDIQSRRFTIFDHGKPAKHFITGGNYEDYRSLITDYLRSENYGQGLQLLLNTFYDDYLPYTDGRFFTPQVKTWLWISIGVGAFLALMIVLIAKMAHKVVRRAAYAGNYVVKNSFRLNHQYDKFVRTYTTRVARPKDTGGSGGGRSSGGFSGGSSSY